MYMENRSTRKGATDNYMEARNAILSRSKVPGAAEYMWLEVQEGRQPDAFDYIIHASNDAKSVPPFSIELYKGGQLESYEVNRDVIRERAVMPEELRQRIVQSQKASEMIDSLVRAPAAAHASI